jgi:transcriptional regulator with XRE-family HTH domain
MSSSRIADAVHRFGHELRRARTQAGLTQRELAVRVRYSREMVAAVERGRRFASREFVQRCDEVFDSGGVLARLWPLVESQQVAADRRRGPRPARRGPANRAVDGWTDPNDWTGTDGWADMIERIRPAIDEVPPELRVQLRDLINNLVPADIHGG